MSWKPQPHQESDDSDSGDDVEILPSHSINNLSAKMAGFTQGYTTCFDISPPDLRGRKSSHGKDDDTLQKRKMISLKSLYTPEPLKPTSPVITNKVGRQTACTDPITETEEFISNAYFEFDEEDNFDSEVQICNYSRELNVKTHDPLAAKVNENEGSCETSGIMLRYNITKKLGKSTFLVKSRGTAGELYILRILETAGITAEEIETTFKAILRVQEHSKHDNIIKILEVERTRDRLYIITEYCEGGTLNALVARARHYGETLNVIEVSDWLVHILRALHHLQTSGASHLDLTSRSILLKNNCAVLGEPLELKLLRKCYQSKTEGDRKTESVKCPDVLVSKNIRTQTEDDCGDAEWLSWCPERYEGNILGHKADIWNAGCVLFELCSQRRPFHAKTKVDFQQKIAGEDLPTLSDLFPHELNQLFQRMVAADPEARPSAAELLEDPYIRAHIEDMDAAVA